MKFIAVISMIILSTGLFAQSENRHIREGNEKYLLNDFEGAVQSYARALEINPESDAAHYNLGKVLYEQGQFNEAAASFQRSAELTGDPELRAQAYHNMGNAFLEQKKYQQSIEAYKKALRNNPQDADTKYNLAYAQRMLEQQKQQKPEQQNQQQQQSNKQEQPEKKEPEEQEQRPPEKPKQEEPKQFSKEELERIIEALNADDKEVQDKINKQKVRTIEKQIEKDW